MIDIYDIHYLVFLCGAFYAHVPAKSWGKAWEQMTDSPRAKVYVVSWKVPADLRRSYQ